MPKSAAQAPEDRKYLPEDLEEDEAELLEGWGRYLKARFPNPDRIACPGAETLKKIAGAPRKFHDRRILDHIARCAPCSNELRELIYTSKHPAT